MVSVYVCWLFWRMVKAMPFYLSGLIGVSIHLLTFSVNLHSPIKHEKYASTQVMLTGILQTSLKHCV